MCWRSEGCCRERAPLAGGRPDGAGQTHRRRAARPRPCRRARLRVRKPAQPAGTERRHGRAPEAGPSQVVGRPRQAQRADAPSRVNPHWCGEGFETYIPLVATAAATIGPAVQSNRFIRRCHAKTSSNLAWAADKRYSLVAIVNLTLRRVLAHHSVFGRQL